MAAPNPSSVRPPDPGDPPASSGDANPSDSRPSFATVAAGSRPKLRARFPPLVLPTRQVGQKDGRPSISFSGAEVGACEKRFEFSLIAKFTVGRPSISEIQKTFQSEWKITGRASISEIWDSRHLLIILDSEEDVRIALAAPFSKIGHAYFRLFRWHPEYNPKKESTITTIWVRLPGLPISIYDTAFIEAIVSTFGYFVAADDRTKACTSLKYARACVELDVTEFIPDSIWISLPNNQGYWQSIIVETKLAYCSRCKVHGHQLSQCRKAKVQVARQKENKEIGTFPTPKFPAESSQQNKSTHEEERQNKSRQSSEQWVKVESRKSKKGKEVITERDSGKENDAEINLCVPSNSNIKNQIMDMVVYEGGTHNQNKIGEDPNFRKSKRTITSIPNRRLKRI